MCSQVEEKALEKEKDKQSQERLGEVRRELGELQDKLKPLQMRYRCDAVRCGGGGAAPWLGGGSASGSAALGRNAGLEACSYAVCPNSQPCLLNCLPT